MGNPKAFLTIPRQEAGYRPVHDRISDYGEVEQTLNTSERKLQASRCMDCGVPFCHWACPLGNRPPEFQDALYRGRWDEAYRLLTQTNDFPEFTGRICPALCEKSCVLNLSMEAPVTIRENEAAIIEAAFREGLVKPHHYKRNGRRVAVIGSGPAGLSVANRLNRLGYDVTVFEKLEYVGGLLRFGIPNFKLHKPIIDRRVRVMEAEGITFEVNHAVELDHLPEVSTSTVSARVRPRPATSIFRGAIWPASILPWRCWLSKTGCWQARPSATKSASRHAARCAGNRWRRYGQRLHRHEQPAGCGQRDPDRNHAEAARRIQSPRHLGPSGLLC